MKKRLMAEKTHLFIPKIIYQGIARWAEEAYPQEGCGLLVGSFLKKGQKKVARFSPLQNTLLDRKKEKAPTLPDERQGEGAGRTEFVMNPSEFNQATLEAEKEGHDIVGVVHTHPDHPPRPSQIDASQPFLAVWSNIIVSVEKGKTQSMKSWVREDDHDPFEEEEIRVGE